MMAFCTVVPAAQARAGLWREAREAVRLPAALRERSRQRLKLPSKLEAGLFLPHGTVLHHGDVIVAEDGYAVRVEAMDEPLTRVALPGPGDMARACYHLGNRHVPLEIGPGYVQYQQDHVLDKLMVRLGYALEHHTGPFQPEAGACPAALAAPGGVEIVVPR